MISTTAGESPSTQTLNEPDAPGAANFVFEVDDRTYEYNRPRITGGEIMAMAGIPSTDGLLQILQDGSRVTIQPDENLALVPGAQFKRRPRFKRGCS